MGASKFTYAVIDEVEEGICSVLFDEGPKLLLSKKLMPEGVEDGTVLKVTFEIDEAERDRRVARIQSIQERLLKKSGKQ